MRRGWRAPRKEICEPARPRMLAQESRHANLQLSGIQREALADVAFRFSRDQSSQALDETWLRERIALANSVQTSARPGESRLSRMVRELGASKLRAAIP